MLRPEELLCAFLDVCTCSACQIGWHRCTGCSQNGGGSASIRGRGGRGTTLASSPKEDLGERRGSQTASQSPGHRSAQQCISTKMGERIAKEQVLWEALPTVPDLQCACSCRPPSLACCPPTILKSGHGQIPPPRNSQPRGGGMEATVHVANAHGGIGPRRSRRCGAPIGVTRARQRMRWRTQAGGQFAGQGSGDQVGRRCTKARNHQTTGHVTQASGHTVGRIGHLLSSTLVPGRCSCCPAVQPLAKPPLTFWPQFWDGTVARSNVSEQIAIETDGDKPSTR